MRIEQIKLYFLNGASLIYLLAKNYTKMAIPIFTPTLRQREKLI